MTATPSEESIGLLEDAPGTNNVYPNGDIQLRRVIISVTDKESVIPLAKALSACGVEILASSGTSKRLAKEDIPTVDVTDVVGKFVEKALLDAGLNVRALLKDVGENATLADLIAKVPNLDHRVVTLWPEIHAAILADRLNPEHMRALADAGIVPVDGVIVSVYDFEGTATQHLHPIADQRKPRATEKDLTERTDVGGPTQIRGAAKNSDFVMVVADKSLYPIVQEEAERGHGRISRGLLRHLKVAAFGVTARYDAAIEAEWADRIIGPDVYEAIRTGTIGDLKNAMRFVIGPARDIWLSRIVMEARARDQSEIATWAIRQQLEKDAFRAAMRKVAEPDTAPAPKVLVAK